MVKKYFIAFVILGFVLSCKKFLSVRPQSEIKEDALFEKERGFVDALTGIYTLLAKQTLYGDNLTMSFLDVLAQYYKAPDFQSPYWNIVNYRYDLDDAKIMGPIGIAKPVSVKSTIKDIWSSSYTAIANANNILDNIDEHKSLFQAGNYNLVKGEALGLRAFLHFDLLRMFGPMMTVNPTTKSIPYRTTLSRDPSPLLPGDEAAKLIIADLLKADTLLKEDPVVTGASNDYYDFEPESRKYHMNELAVQAMLARAYMYINQPDQAYIYAKKVIGSGKFNFVTNQNVSEPSGCRDRVYYNEQLFTLLVNNMKKYTDGYFSPAPYIDYVTTKLNNDDYVLRGLYDNSSTDYRLQYLFTSSSGKLWPSKYIQFESAGQCLNDFPKNIVPVVHISEMYYIAAESSPDMAEAVSLLNVVRIHRGLDPLGNITDRSKLQQALTKEYQKEFFGEGQLFYYYKRLGFAAIPGDPNKTVADSKVYVMPLPDDELSYIH